jgi:peptidoglycan LD-endopeptidase CwlK
MSQLASPAPAPHVSDFVLGRASLQRLIGVHPDMNKVVRLAIKRSRQDFAVLEGVRSDEQMYANYGKGRTAAELAAKGVPAVYARPWMAKVTWLNNPLGSEHRRRADGFGRAVDLIPYHGPGVSPWPEHHPPALRARYTQAFDEVARAMLEAAAELGVPIRWGADWDGDGKARERGESDSPHFELVRS